MSDIVRVAVIITIVVGLAAWAVQHQTSDEYAAAQAYLAALEKRPYTGRNLVAEHGWDLSWRPSSGPMSYLGTASRANKYNNMLRAEASRIQIELEDHGMAAYRLLGLPADFCDRIARQRFEDQGILPP